MRGGEAESERERESNSKNVRERERVEGNYTLGRKANWSLTGDLTSEL